MTRVWELIVGPDDGEMRLDRWLRRHVANLPQAWIERACRTGALRIDGARARASDRVVPGQRVRLPPVPADFLPKGGALHAGVPALSPQSTEAPADGGDNSVAERARALILWMDDHLIALNKPPGLASQGGSGQGDRHIDALSAYLTFGARERPVLVHRLDKDTSGVLLLARSTRVARKLGEAFRNRAPQKIYWALVEGVPFPRRGRVDFGLVKRGGPRNERMHCIDAAAVDVTPGALSALTEYVVLKEAGTDAAWVALRPVTGRTHQLRAHMAALGHAIVGDGKYSRPDAPESAPFRARLPGGQRARQLHLHARSLSFDHPMTGARITLSAPLPAHMAKTWTALGWSEADAPNDPFACTRGAKR